MSAGALRLDVVTIFPDYLAAARPLADRQGPRAGADRPAGARPARLHPRPAPHRRRHAVRRRRRHGHAPRAVGRGAGPRAWPTGRTPAGPGGVPHLIVPGPGGRAVHPGDGARAGGASRGWRSPAGATRASTSGCTTRRASGCRSASSRLGDYVLNGGEVAVLAMVEAVARLLPGVIGNAELAGRGVARGRPAGVPRLHQAAALARARHPGGAALGPPRADRPVAAGRAAAAYGPAPAGPDRAGSTRPTLDARDREVLEQVLAPDFGRGPPLWQTDSSRRRASRAPATGGVATTDGPVAPPPTLTRG